MTPRETSDQRYMGGQYVGPFACLPRERGERTDPVQVERIAEKVQQIPGPAMKLACVDQGHTDRTSHGRL